MAIAAANALPADRREGLFRGRAQLAEGPALLPDRADNDASCSIGRPVRLFDDRFTQDAVRNAAATVLVEGEDGGRLDGLAAMNQISRDPLDRVGQALSAHQHPDGLALVLNPLFAPIRDRDAPGRGFTHTIGDRATVVSPRLGRLVNRVATSKAAPLWAEGIDVPMRNRAEQGLLAGPATR